ncbi:hypothetical protein APHAL10511_002867 [Amanita phalloides]|nr:hypothetical protein APHAL10511_002867 [Amanita phalloides]
MRTTSQNSVDTVLPLAILPPQVPLDVEGYPRAPDGLELEQVHVYVRHGERAPVGVRLADRPAYIPPHWIMCKEANEFRRAVSSVSTDIMPIAVERLDRSSVQGECFLGQLTDLGRHSTYAYGASLRKLYVERLGLLSESFEESGQIYLRSTNVPRTIESLQQIARGLCPQTKCNHTLLPPILVRNGKDENLYGNTYACKRLEALQLGFTQAAAAAFNPTLESLDDKLSKYNGNNPIRVDGKPRASGIMDTIRAAVAHGINVPAEFRDRCIVDTIERAIVSEWFAGYKTEEVRRLGMGPLLADMSRKMQNKTEKGTNDPLKLLIHSTHDTAIAALCATLEVYDEKWPAFTSSITFELFKKGLAAPSTDQTVFSPFRQKPSSEHFVRVRHQNKNIALPICAEEGKHLPGHPELCTFAAFRERVRELTPVDWESECSTSSKV